MRIGFLAVKGTARAQVLEALGEIEGDVPATLWSGSAVGVSPDGWVIVVKPDPEFPTSAQLAAASAQAEAVGYSACTVVMWTSACGYKDGCEVWRVEHDGQQGDHLEASGDLPPSYEAALETFRQKKADGADNVDYVFDVTENILTPICGFHPEIDFDFAFTALRPPPRRPGLLSRLFGRS